MHRLTDGEVLHYFKNTRSEAMKALVKMAERAAARKESVLIMGETGVGKDLLARYIHLKSARVKRSFVKINCKAIPRELLESELFGYEQGAFTGAVRSKLGKFERAHRGSLFLDEVGDMEPQLQAKVNHFFDDRTVMRVGATISKSVNVKILASTNRDLRQDVVSGNFREDLFYRLGEIILTVPPLRTRTEDLPIIIEKLTNKKIEPKVYELLERYPFLGNVRELSHILTQAEITRNEDTISASAIQGAIYDFYPEDYNHETSKTGMASLSLGYDLRKWEKALIIGALEKESYSQKDAADLLGISPRALLYKIDKYKIQPPEGTSWRKER